MTEAAKKFRASSRTGANRSYKNGPASGSPAQTLNPPKNSRLQFPKALLYEDAACGLSCAM
jgi:hypothetical protein